MQRLMNVTREMNDEPQCVRSISRIACRVLENLHLLGECKRDAALRRVASETSPLGSARDVDEMPACCFGMPFAIIVGPSCGVFDWIGCDWLAEAVEAGIDRILSENLIHHCQRVGIEVLLGDERDCLMAFATPGECARTMQKTGTEYKSDENCQASPIQVSTSV